MLKLSVEEFRPFDLWSVPVWELHFYGAVQHIPVLCISWKLGADPEASSNWFHPFYETIGRGVLWSRAHDIWFCSFLRLAAVKAQFLHPRSLRVTKWYFNFAVHFLISWIYLQGDVSSHLLFGYHEINSYRKWIHICFFLSLIYPFSR